MVYPIKTSEFLQFLGRRVHVHSSEFSSFPSEFEKSTLIGYKILENSEIGILTWINHISKFIPQKSSELRQLSEGSEIFS
jgi:predicted metal-binding transcription factor (methanogenesis marker protein 9)